MAFFVIYKMRETRVQSGYLLKCFTFEFVDNLNYYTHTHTQFFNSLKLIKLICGRCFIFILSCQLLIDFSSRIVINLSNETRAISHVFHFLHTNLSWSRLNLTQTRGN